MKISEPPPLSKGSRAPPLHHTCKRKMALTWSLDLRMELAHSRYTFSFLLFFWRLGVEKSGPYSQENKPGLSISSRFQKKDLKSCQGGKKRVTEGLNAAYKENGLLRFSQSMFVSRKNGGANAWETEMRQVRCACYSVVRKMEKLSPHPFLSCQRLKMKTLKEHTDRVAELSTSSRLQHAPRLQFSILMMAPSEVMRFHNVFHGFHPYMRLHYNHIGIKSHKALEWMDLGRMWNLFSSHDFTTIPKPTNHFTLH